MDLSTRIARRNLAPRREPYWHRISAGCFLGYRVSTRPEGGGSWIARYRDPDTAQHKYHSLGEFADFDPARRAAEEWFNHVSRSGTTQILTVAEIAAQYVKDLKAEGREKTATEAKERFARHLNDTTLAKVLVTDLKPRHLRLWRDALAAKMKPDSANRNYSMLRAALNAAHKNLQISDDSAWRATPLLEKSGNRRERWLNQAERQKLLEAVSDEFRPFVLALTLSGARPGEIAPAKVSDFSRQGKTLSVSGKTGSRTFPVSQPLYDLLVEQSKDKLPGALLFPRADGSQWTNYSWRKPMREAATKCGWGHEVSAYTMRHSFISEALSAGIPAFTVSAIVGTGLPMIQKHYGHLIHEHAHDQLNSVSMV